VFIVLASAGVDKMLIFFTNADNLQESAMTQPSQDSYFAATASVFS